MDNGNVIRHREFKDQTDEEYRQEKQKEYNKRQKRFSRVIGENFATIGLFLVMAIMIGSIWTEIGITSNWRRFIGEALTTIVLYILADVYSSTLGVRGGKLDDDYINDHEKYLSLRQKVREEGIVLMDVFCDWQIEVEYEHYLRRRCRELKIDYHDYIQNYHGKSLEELQNMFEIESVSGETFKKKVFSTYKNAKTSSKAAKIFSLNQIKPIDLTPDILMTDGRVRNDRGGVSKGGEEYVDEHTTGWKNIIVTALWAIFAAIPVITLISEFSLGMIIYTVFKIALMIYRMSSGYSRGAKAFNSVEPKHLQDKIKYLYLYLEFVDKKIYLKIKNKYNIVELVGEEDSNNEKDN